MIFCIEEKKFDNYDVINVPGYFFFETTKRKIHKTKSGSIELFVKFSLVSSIEIIDTPLEYVFGLKTDNYNKNYTEKCCVVGPMYIPPTQSRFFQQFLKVKFPP